MWSVVVELQFLATEWLAVTAKTCSGKIAHLNAFHVLSLVYLLIQAMYIHIIIHIYLPDRI